MSGTRSYRRLAGCVGLALVVGLGGQSFVGSARAEGNEALFARGAKVLAQGQFQQAIDHFELLADRGFVHPDASYNRGVAYIERARSSAAVPGDLGRASAALYEVLELRPGDDEAEKSLAAVLQEISRRRAKQNDAPVVVRPSFARAITSLASERTWSIGAAVGSLLLCAGICLRMLAKSFALRLAGALCLGLGLVGLGVFSALGLTARHFRQSSDPAVVVVPEARLLDENGTPIEKKGGVPEFTSIVEGAYVYRLEKQGRLAKVQWGNDVGWIWHNQLRMLRTP